jgi:nicotinate-nucleotide adenylyltransferase
MEKVSLDSVVFMPSGQPPLKSRDLASPIQRMHMVRLAIASNPRFCASDIEFSGEGKSYTVFTISDLKRKYPSDELFYILGSDAFIDMPNWKEPGSIINSVNLVVVMRPGISDDAVKSSPFAENLVYDADDPEMALLQLKGGRQAVVIAGTSLDISSSQIRERIKKRLSVKYLLPPDVEEYILANNIYNC